MRGLNAPAVVNVTRGNHIESRHGIDIVVADGAGHIVEAWGNPDLELFPRSSIKALQAILLVESGAADAFGFSTAQLALACASHSGQPIHTKTARQMLENAGLTPHDLECGTHAPEREEDIMALGQSGMVANALHNNCSGKHAGFLAYARHCGYPTENYIDRTHPVQRDLAQILEQLTKVAHNGDNCAIDGCSIPTYRIPLKSLATAFARFGVGQAESADRGAAMLRLRDACFSHPEMVGGTDSTCTKTMKVLKDLAFVKIGAEGVYTASLPSLGLGVALKAYDGSKRAAEAAVIAVVDRLLSPANDLPGAFIEMKRSGLKNRNGLLIGEIFTEL